MFAMSLRNWIRVESNPQSQAVHTSEYGWLNQPTKAHLVPVIYNNNLFIIVLVIIHASNKRSGAFEVWMQFMTVKQKRHWPFNLSSSKTRFMAFKGNLPDWKVKEIFNNIQSMLMEDIIWYLKAWDVNNLLHCNSVGVNTVAASKRDTFTHRICFSSILCRRSHVFFYAQSCHFHNLQASAV